LLRLRGWGRDGGIHGRLMTGRAPLRRDGVRKNAGDRVSEMRRAAALYLTSRACVARDVAHILLPERKPAEEPAARSQSGEAAGDLLIFTKRGVILVGFAMAKRRPAAALSRMAGRLRDLGQNCRIIHAETPAHAVEQLARLLEEVEG
jgi:hypothetical protein